MMRLLCLGVVTCGGWLLAAPAAHAQFYLRVPFVRVQVGPTGGVAVRAPFVRYYDPGYPPPAYYVVPRVYVPPPPPVNEFVPPTLPVPRPLPSEEGPVAPMPPAPNGEPDPLAPPAPRQAPGLTLEQFGKSFQPKAGSYEVEIVNPVTRQPTKVRFTLPEGTPRRVHVGRRDVEFVYGPRQFVRIEFDRDGALVTSR